MHITFRQYHQFSVNLEGRVPKMYCDVFGFITTGVGNLINTLHEALALPWLLEDGTPASQADIAADWNLLHADALTFGNLKWTVYAHRLKCHLSEQSIDELVARTLATNEGYFRKRWPKYDTFPADAQLAMLSMSWAVGAAFYKKFPNLATCIDHEDWDGCVATCKIRDGLDTPQKSDDNMGIVPRNARNKFLFHNAAIVKAGGGDITILHWPDVAPDLSGLKEAAARAAKASAELQSAAEAQFEWDKRSDTDPSELAPESKV